MFFTTVLQFLWGHNYKEMINVVIWCCFAQLQVLATIVDAIKYSYSVNKYNHCWSCYIKKVIVFIHSLFNIYWPCFRQHILVMCGKYRDVTLKNHSFCPKKKNSDGRKLSLKYSSLKNSQFGIATRGTIDRNLHSPQGINSYCIQFAKAEPAGLWKPNLF